jgi:glycosyltransferase involved in cell wall biosynthesis
METPLIVLIATAGQHTLLEGTLESLAKCIKPKTFQKTLVVENGKKYFAQDIVHKYAQSLSAEYLHTPLANKSAALNFALEGVADETLIFFTDDDVVFSEQLLQAYAAKAEKHKQNAFFGGPTIPEYEQPPPAWIIPSLPPSARGFRYDADNFRNSMFLGFNWAAYARDIRALKGFDPNYGPGTQPKRTGQETDMQARLLKAGLKEVYVQDAKVWHHVPASSLNLRWVLKRKFQGGVGKGMRKASGSKGRTVLFSLLREVLKSLIGCIGVIFSSKERKVSALSSLFGAAGKVRGYYMK